MAILDDIVALETYVKAQFPSATTGKQTIPEQPSPGSFYIRFQSEDRAVETSYTYRIERAYQIVAYAKWPEEIIPRMETLSRALYQDGYVEDMRVISFAYSSPVKTGGGLFACVGMLNVESREHKSLAQSDVIEHVSIRI